MKSFALKSRVSSEDHFPIRSPLLYPAELRARCIILLIRLALLYSQCERA